MKINYKFLSVLSLACLMSKPLSAQQMNAVQNNAVNVQQNDVQEPKRTCGSDIMPQQFEDWLQSIEQAGGGKGNSNMSTQSVFNIPVIVHVIHNGTGIGSGSNVSNAQIISQINILNRDFNGTNTDTNLIPAAFKPLLGKFKINFCLAVVNPTGGILAEPGVNRINRNTAGWTAPPYTNMTYWNNTIKPQSIWDVNRYMNMWVGDLGSGLLGFATFPNPGTSGLSGIPAPYGSATTDGVVINFTAFGNTGTAQAPFNLGRTATHEVGHWLGLRHVWGDASCGSDFCNDTPTQSNSTYNCPSYPNAAGCTGSPNPPGRMFMNFMDYTNDNCMYMFTHDQAYRAQLIMTNSSIRAALLTSTVCNLPSVTNDLGIMYVASPTYSQVISCDNFINPVIAVKNFGSNAITSATYTYNVNGLNTQTFNWTGNIAPNATLTLNLPTINSVPNGTNGLNVRITSVNGGPDTYTTNNFNNQLFYTVNGFSIAASGASTVCASNPATLTASGSASSYTWNPGNISGTVAVVNPAATTIYTLSGSSGTCVTTRTVQVTVNPSPTVAVNNQTICTGGTATLVASGASTYSWSTSQTNATITVNPLSNTVYTVTGSIGSCSNTKTVSVTIGTQLGINIAATSTAFCSGGTATLTASGANTYTWSTTSNNASIVVSPTATTVYTVNGSAGTCNGSKTISVNVTASPTVVVANASQTTCTGDAVTLSASGASNYTWTPGNQTSSSINVAPVSTTVYSVTGANGICTNVKTATVTVNLKPTVNAAASSNTMCLGASISLFANGANTYTWNPGNQVGMPINVSPSSNTTYTVTGEASNGCKSTNTVEITVSPCTGLSINAADVAMIQVYPNPFKDELTINAVSQVTVKLVNALGQVVKSETVTGKSTINTSELPKAIYFIQIQTATGNKVMKLIKD